MSNAIVGPWINKYGDCINEGSLVRVRNNYSIFSHEDSGIIEEIFWNGGFYVCKVRVNNVLHNFPPDEIYPIDMDLGI